MIRRFFVALSVTLLLLVATKASAQTPAALMAVEEDWELVVAQPDVNSAGPQVTCSIFPTHLTDTLNATILLNHRTIPDFAAGGLQLQLWDGDYVVATRRIPNESVLSNDGETVTWTVRLEISHQNELLLSIFNGNSTTWGSFGNQGYLNITMPTTLPDLSGYSMNNSMNNSGVSFASNHVQSLKLLRVRLTDANNVTNTVSGGTVFPK